MAEDDTTTVDDARANADFGAGFEGTDKPETPAKPDVVRTARPSGDPEAAATPRTEAQPEPEPPKYIQITATDWAAVQAAAAKAATYEAQIDKAFGTIGNLTRRLNEQQRAAEPPAPTAPAKPKYEIPKDAFAEMERDFPELAAQQRAVLEKAFASFQGGGATDPETIVAIVTAERNKQQLAELAADHPDWRDVVGAVAAGEQPDPNQPFRKWLASKDAAYQTRVNAAETAAVIGRAINLFRKETAAPAKPAATPRDQARVERIRGAVQPRGDSTGAPAANTDHDAFLDGFAGR